MQTITYDSRLISYLHSSEILNASDMIFVSQFHVNNVTRLCVSFKIWLVFTI